MQVATKEYGKFEGYMRREQKRGLGRKRGIAQRQKSPSVLTWFIYLDIDCFQMTSIYGDLRLLEILFVI